MKKAIKKRWAAAGALAVFAALALLCIPAGAAAPKAYAAAPQLADEYTAEADTAGVLLPFPDDDGGWSYKITVYDASGAVVSVGDPFVSGGLGNYRVKYEGAHEDGSKKTNTEAETVEEVLDIED